MDWNKINNHTVKSYNFTNDRIIIDFVETQQKLEIDPIGECCSVSWFEKDDKSDLNLIIGKKIIGLSVSNECIDHKPKHKPKNNEYDQFHQCQIKTNDDSDVRIILCNSSNGYYDGWIECKVYDPVENKHDTIHMSYCDG